MFVLRSSSSVQASKKYLEFGIINKLGVQKKIRGEEFEKNSKINKRGGDVYLALKSIGEILQYLLLTDLYRKLNSDLTGFLCVLLHYFA